MKRYMPSIDLDTKTLLIAFAVMTAGYCIGGFLGRYLF